MPKRVTETSTDYERPYRPLPIALLNAVGRAGGHLGLPGKLDVGSMIARARRKTGLASFGDEWFMEPLSVLVRSINAEADLTTLGRFIQKRRIEGALATRLRVEELIRIHPEIRDIDLGSVVVIAGLQRTGTTTLHRLIASHPEMRAITAWEGLNPLPLPHEGAGRPPRPDQTGAHRGTRDRLPGPCLPCRAFPPNTTPRRRTCSCSTCPS